MDSSFLLRNQRGNVLFLILIAVALFAALSYAVTTSTRTTGGTGKAESVAAQAASIMQFFAAVDVAIMRMRMNGIPIENISFVYNFKDYDGTITTPGNSNCTTDACRVFKPAGGGVSPVAFESLAVANPSSWTASNTMPGYFALNMYQWPDAGTSLNDIIIRIIAIKPEICQELNRKLGIAAAPTFSGTMVGANTVSNWDTGTSACSSNCGQISGNTTFTNATAEYCSVYHLVIAR